MGQTSFLKNIRSSQGAQESCRNHLVNELSSSRHNRVKELSGRVALVTGAGRNIGRSIAMELAAAGAAVVVNARSSASEANAVAAEIVALGGKALALMADVTDAAAVQTMIGKAVVHFGRLDILVNNAAVRGEGEFEAISLADWHATLGVVLDGAFICAQAALPHLRASRNGAIINIGGLTGHTGASHRVHVVTAKAGLAGMTRALAHDLAGDGITVNCVAPGMIDTIRTGDVPRHRSERVTPLQRRGRPDDVAGAIVWLAGPAARFVTGQTIHVNGGTYMN
jgi:3-oxoacyl-[acyl-carrier protein] reductase